MQGPWNGKLDKSRDYPAKKVVLLTVLEARGSRATAHQLARMTEIGRATGNVIETVDGTDTGSASVTGNATRNATENGRRIRIGNVVTEIENATETGIGTGIVTVVMTRIEIVSRARTERDPVKFWRLQPPPPPQSPEVFLLDPTLLDTVPPLRLAMMLLAKDDVLPMTMSVSLFGQYNLLTCC